MYLKQSNRMPILRWGSLRKIMRIFITFTTIVTLIASNICLAADSQLQAESFAKTFSSACLTNLTNLENLRIRLKDQPKLPPKKSSHFLSGHPGDVWPVPDKNGLFVLALPSDKNLCAVFAQKANTTKAEELFKNLVTQAPVPLLSKLVSDKYSDTSSNGKTHTISYEWSVPNATKKMLFMLTTAASKNAQLQVLGTASMEGN